MSPVSVWKEGKDRVFPTTLLEFPGILRPSSLRRGTVGGSGSGESSGLLIRSVLSSHVDILQT